MQQSLIIISTLVISLYLLLKLRHELHMMQQNSYRNERYGKWLKNDFKQHKRSREFIFIILIIILFTTGFTKTSLTGIVLIFSVLSYMLLTKKQKKSLVFTRRVQRLAALALVLYIIFIAIGFREFGMEKLPLFIALLSALSFAVIFTANFLIKPLEKQINNRYYRDAQRILKQHSGLIVIGITGSYGKTSTKHFLQRILSEKYHVLMTPGSYNTTMGVVRTIREMLQPTHEVFIVEMGAKQPGDIAEIARLVQPQIGIITAVGAQHLETFKTIENIQKTKFELVDALPADGLAVLNYDYELIRNRPVSNTQTLSYASRKGNTGYYIDNVTYNTSGTRFSVFQKNRKLGDFKTKLLGEYNLSNLLSGIAVARHLNIPGTKIAFAVSKIESVAHRLQLKTNANGITIIDDAFNANPKGAEMALNVLKNIEGKRKIIITPGMIELGEKQIYYNQIFAEQMAKTCDYIILVGTKITRPIQEKLEAVHFDKKRIFVAENFTEAVAHLNAMVQPGDVLLYENDLPDSYEN